MRDGACLLDAHSHIHPSFDAAASLDGARANFRRARRELGLAEGTSSVLMLADPPGSSTITERLDGIGHAWTYEPVERETIRVHDREKGSTLFIVLGRQVETSEGLEVLALATTETFDDRMDLRSAVEAVLDSNAVAVLPAGVGKWMGRRGRLVDGLLNRHGGGRLLLCDNGGRWVRLPEPRAFRTARGRRIPILAGSDPLPLRTQQRRNGSYGSVLSHGFDPTRPAQSLRELLRGLREQPPIFGIRTRLIPFLFAQSAMQLRKLLPSTAPGGSEAREE